MVDEYLPIESQERPLRYLFLDLNAYFASCEQQERPELRGKPTIVVPVDADTSFAIAASYEAKAFGIKTGTQIGEAKQKCPNLQVVRARPQVYVAYHNAIIKAADTVLPVEEVCSIDEMRFRLLRTESPPEVAIQLAKRIKAAIQTHVGSQMKCSVGIAPNPFLSKIATEIQKPDGLVVLEAKDLPHKLLGLKLTDFTGINRRMAARLNASGIFSSEDLCRANRHELRSAFGSVVGERWWFYLRGFVLSEDHHDRKSLGHSHVLPPDLRTDQGCREVLLRLLQKASARLRSIGLYTEEMIVSVKSYEKAWSARVKLPPTQDTIKLNAFFLEAWEGRDFSRPRAVSVTFYELKPREEVTFSLFDEEEDRTMLNSAVDELNQKFGKNSIYLAGMHGARNTAKEKIAFGKTLLFSEGKGDNEWIDTFRGPGPSED